MSHRALARMVPAALLAALATPAPAANLLVNPSFDPGVSGWSRSPATWPACAQAPSMDSGAATVALACTAPPVEAGWVQTVPVQGGAGYRVSHRVSTAGLSGAADVVLSFRDGGVVVWEPGVQEVSGTQAWSTLVWDVVAPAAATSVQVFVGVRLGTAGSASFDDVALEPLADAGPRELVVDLASDVGMIRPLAQSNRGPITLGRDGATNDFGARLREAGVTVLRQHDVHSAYDMHVVFPNAGADETLESSYDFAATDAAIDQARAGGFEVFYRLGESYGEAKTPRMSAAKWAEVVRRVVLHVNGDWAGGIGAGVRYWEIWNEANGPLFWSGTAEQFYELFAAAAKAVKAADPTARVGGPGMAGHENEAWLRGLLRHCRAAGAPVDFVSWHIYHMGNPLTLARAQRQIRALVDEEGFGGAEVLNSEWNLNGGQSCERVGCSPYVAGAYNAAHAAAALAYLQDTDIPMAFRYRTDGAGMFGLFGVAGEPAWARCGLAFAMLARFAATPVRLAAGGSDEAGFAVLAGRSADGAQAHVVIADQGSAARSYRLRLDGAPARFAWSVEAIADDVPCTAATCSTALVAAGDEGDLVAGAIEVAIAAPAVHLVRVAAAPPERTPRRRLDRRY